MTGRHETHTPQRSFRIPDDLYIAAQTKAEGEGETVTDVIRRALEGYVTGEHDAPAHGGGEGAASGLGDGMRSQRTR